MHPHVDGSLTQVKTTNGIMTGSPVLAGLTIMTNRTRNLSYRLATHVMSCCWAKGLNVERGSLKVIESCTIYQCHTAITMCQSICPHQAFNYHL